MDRRKHCRYCINSLTSCYGSVMPGHPIIQAATRGQHDLLISMIAAGCDVNVHMRGGSNALHAAATRGHQGIVETLVRAGAHLDAPGRKGRTALMCAVKNGYIEIAKILLKANAEVDVKDGHGCTAFLLATDPEMLSLLIWYGCNMEAHGFMGNVSIVGNGGMRRNVGIIGNAMIMATYRGNIECLRVLIENDMNLESQDIEGYTPLGIGARIGHLPIVQLLIEVR